ncbi:ABC transporter permease [Dactylosporangium sp. NPDC051484]|uniref:ABC transporter permease n=1 Tax=Dactylosporangium sp. NPDC051484 TaxID=3154942 RepID=UPI00344FEB3D
MNGTLALLRLALRLDRVRLPIWLAALTLCAAGSASSFASAYPTAADRAGLLSAANANPTFAALYGHAHSADIGALTAWRLTTFYGVIAGLMTVFLVIRHTRTDEEAGRLEMLRATVVGRHAALAAALLEALIANTALAVLVGLTMPAPHPGGLALGAAFAGTGLTAGAVAALAAQLTESPRTATGIAGAYLGAAYGTRAVADAAGIDWLRWVSPIGWAQQVRPYAGDRWWILALFAALVAVLAAATWALAARRDVGAGLLAARPGRAEGRLTGPFALAWRLQRGTLIAWLIGFATAGLGIGVAASSVADFVDGPDSTAGQLVARLGGTGGLVDAYLATSLSLCAMVAGLYTVTAVLRLRGEETALHAEPVLATGVTRRAWMAAHLAIAFAGTAALLLVLGAGAGLAHGGLPRVLAATAALIPAAWVVGGIAAALFGLLPRAATAASAAVGAFLLIAFLGPILKAPGWVQDLSPYTHTPHLPGPAPAGGLVTPLTWLTVTAAALTTAGLIGFRRRDIG